MTELEFEGFPVAELKTDNGDVVLEIIRNETYAVIKNNSAIVELNQKNHVDGGIDSVYLSKE